DTKKVNTVAVNNFKVEFKNASDVTWTATDTYVKATFILNSEKIEAFYNENGEKIGTSRAISIEELPVKAKRAFAKKFDGYTVKQAIEFNGTEETAYYIAADNEKEAVILKVTSSDELSTYKRTKK